MKVLSLPSAYSNESFVVFGAYFAGLFCIIGHIYPLYFGFRGGKGVLTTLGMMLILDWKVALICLGIFIVVVALSRMVSLGSCSAVACLPIVTALFHLFVYHSEPLMVAFCTVMALGIAAILIESTGRISSVSARGQKASSLLAPKRVIHKKGMA